MDEMSSSVKNVCQWFSSAALAPGRESNVYWSTAEAKSPVKRSPSIQDSRTSQPPRLTPRRNGIVVLATDVVEGAVVVNDEASEEVTVGTTLLGVEIMDEEIVGGIIEVVRVGIGRVGIDIDIEEIGIEKVGSPKEAMVWREKKGMVEEGAFAIVPLAMVGLDGEGRVWLPVPFPWW